MQIIQSTLPLYKFTIHIQATSPISFYNFPGIAFRGGFGWMLKKSVCVYRKIENNCKGCLFINNCVYANVFESINCYNTSIMKKASHLPHPFVLTPILKDNVIKKDDTFIVNLTIIGKAISYFPYFVYSIINLGKIGINKTKGTFVILNIKNNGDNSEIYNIESGIVEKNIKPINFSNGFLNINDEVNHLKIQYLTPCRIIQSNKEIGSLTYDLIIKNILRRIKILSNLYGIKIIDIENYEDILDEARQVSLDESNIHWEIHERYSRRQNNRMPLKGFKGYMIFNGKIKLSYPLLKIAEIINIGKNTSFGYGAVKIESLY